MPLLIQLALVASLSTPCDKLPSFAEERDCALTLRNEADSSQRKTYQELVTFIRSHASQDPDVDASAALKALAQSQNAWAAFRKYRCRYIFETAAGGTGTLAGYASTKCEAQMAEDRAQDLHQQLLLWAMPRK